MSMVQRMRQQRAVLAQRRPPPVTRSMSAALSGRVGAQGAGAALRVSAVRGRAGAAGDGRCTEGARAACSVRTRARSTHAEI